MASEAVSERIMERYWRFKKTNLVIVGAWVEESYMEVAIQACPHQGSEGDGGERGPEVTGRRPELQH